MKRKKKKIKKLFSKVEYRRFRDVDGRYQVCVNLHGNNREALPMVAVDGLLEGMTAIVFIENGWKHAADADKFTLQKSLVKQVNVTLRHAAVNDGFMALGMDDYLDFGTEPAPQLLASLPGQSDVALLRDEDVTFSFHNIIDDGYEALSIFGTTEGLAENLAFLIYYLAFQNFCEQDNRQVCAFLERFLEKEVQKYGEESRNEERFTKYLQPWITAIQQQTEAECSEKDTTSL